jgi:hypothetical protein
MTDISVSGRPRPTIIGAWAKVVAVEIVVVDIRKSRRAKTLNNALERQPSSKITTQD